MVINLLDKKSKIIQKQLQNYWNIGHLKNTARSLNKIYIKLQREGGTGVPMCVPLWWHAQYFGKMMQINHKTCWFKLRTTLKCYNCYL